MISNPVLERIKGIWRRFASVLTKKEVVKEAISKKHTSEVQERPPISTGLQTKPATLISPDIQKSLAKIGQTQPHQALSAGFYSGRHIHSKKQKKGSRKNLKSK
jgi:hypothetical protein